MADALNELEVLAARVLRPVRARLDEARAAVEGVTEAAEAWELLAARGVIPAEWIGQTDRSFSLLTRVDQVTEEPEPLDEGEDDDEDGDDADEPEDDAAPVAAAATAQNRRMVTRTFTSWRTAPSPAPPTVAACVAFASDVPGVLQAEALARELCTRLAWRGVVQPNRVLWCVVPRGQPPWGWPHEPLRPVRIALDFARPSCAMSYEDETTLIARAKAAAASGSNGVDSEFACNWRDQLRWRVAVERGCTYNGQPFAGRPDPFAPALALWSTGYLLSGIDPRSGGIGLWAPALDDET